MTRRTLLDFAVFVPCLAQGRNLTPEQLPQPFAMQLGIDAEWFPRQSKRQKLRIEHGSAEHTSYYLLQSKSFTDEPPVEPMHAAHRKIAFPQRRAEQFVAATPACDRHRLVRGLYDSLGWTLERCYEHTMAFLRAKEIEEAPLDVLYQGRGLSSDTSPESLLGLASLELKAERVLLAGPGLDLTRREKFTDELPLKSHQLEYLRSRFRQVDAVDIRPEVIAHLGAKRHDLTTEVLSSRYDLVVATNLLVYLNEAELLCALAGLSQALAAGGVLLHNDLRFAAKVFGEAVDLPVEKYEAVAMGGRKWDRIVIHRKGPQ